MSCCIRFSHDPSHLQNFGSMRVFGLLLLVYRAQFVNHPQMSRKKSSKIHPKTKVRNYYLNRSPVHSSYNCTRPPLFNLILCIHMRSNNVILKSFDWMNVPPLCSCARNFVPVVARSTPLPWYKPSGVDGGSYTWAPVEAVS